MLNALKYLDELQFSFDRKLAAVVNMTRRVTLGFWSGETQTVKELNVGLFKPILETTPLSLSMNLLVWASKISVITKRLCRSVI